VNIFEKGDYQPISAEFRTLGMCALEELSKFQNQFEIYDTDTTINAIRDAIIANYLNFDLLNKDKHGFDAKKSKDNQFLEVKQCSVSSGTWGGIWNDTNEEKALAFSDARLFTVVGLWKGANDLMLMVYGQHPELGRHLHSLVVGRKDGSRSTQSVSIQKLIKDFNFEVLCPPDKTPDFIYKLLITHHKNFAQILNKDDIRKI
jgi:hypothetical protein